MMGSTVPNDGDLTKEQKTMTDPTPCPRNCGRLLAEPIVRNALSRVDNQTYICSSCGTNEALFNYYLQNGGDVPFPPLDRPVFEAV